MENGQWTAVCVAGCVSSTLPIAQKYHSALAIAYRNR